MIITNVSTFLWSEAYQCSFKSQFMICAVLFLVKLMLYLFEAAPKNCNLFLLILAPQVDKRNMSAIASINKDL